MKDLLFVKISSYFRNNLEFNILLFNLLNYYIIKFQCQTFGKVDNLMSYNFLTISWCNTDKFLFEILISKLRIEYNFLQLHILK